MRVELDHYQPSRAAGGGLGSFLEDFMAAMEEAQTSGNQSGVDRLRHLWLVFLVDTLSQMSPEQLREYIESREVWGKYEDVAVFRTAGTPCVAYTAIEFEEDDVLRLYAMGVCNELSDAHGRLWWQETIRPRIKELSAGL